jgi:hypothetical protein
MYSSWISMLYEVGCYILFSIDQIGSFKKKQPFILCVFMPWVEYLRVIYWSQFEGNIFET